jgi:hypothetical protein
VETAEKKARADKTIVPAWILMIEGTNQQHVSEADQFLLAALAKQWPAALTFETSSYQHEHTCDHTP